MREKVFPTGSPNCLPLSRPVHSRSSACDGDDSSDMDECLEATGSTAKSVASDGIRDPWGCMKVGLKVDTKLDEGEVDAAQRRLMAAVDAEHEDELRSHAEKLAGCRESLAKKGVMLIGLCVEEVPRSDNMFRVFKPRNERLPKNHRFSVKQGITLLSDLSKLEEALSPQIDENSKLVEDIGAEGNFQFKSGSSDQKGSSPSCAGDGSSTASDGTCDYFEDDMLQVKSSRKSGRYSCGTEEPVSDALKATKATVESCLKGLGLEKCFDGTVHEVHDTYIIISSRNDIASGFLDENKGACWAMFDSLCDVTYRRQRAAVSNLGRFMITKSTSALGDTPPHSNEARVRKILLAKSKSSCMSACSMAAARVEWMTDSALAELDIVLSKSRLNNQQIRTLRDAYRRTVNLLQGPPGTGKSRTLAAAVKAFCHVFHDPGFADEASRRGFALPTMAEFHKWTDVQVRTWLESLVPVEEKQVAVDGEDSRFLPRAATGVNMQIKKWLLDGTVLASVSHMHYTCFILNTAFL